MTPGVILRVTGILLLRCFSFGRPIWWLHDGSATVAGLAAGVGSLLITAILVAK